MLDLEMCALPVAHDDASISPPPASSVAGSPPPFVAEPPVDHFAGKKNLIPKIQTVTWDSDKNPDGFHEWSVTIASIVQTMPGGRSLELFLDQKLNVFYSTNLL